MKFRLETNLPNYLRESEEIVRAFSPFITIDSNASDYLKIDVKSFEMDFNVVINSSLATDKIIKLCRSNESDNRVEACYKKVA